MGFIAWIVVGAIAGFLANLIMGSRQGLLMMVVLGIVGGLVGGFVATTVLEIGSVDGINLESIVIATLGAIAVVFVASFVTRPRGLAAPLRSSLPRELAASTITTPGGRSSIRTAKLRAPT